MSALSISHNVSLKPFNTFGLDVKAHEFAAFKSVDDLNELRTNDRFKGEHLILGGGSNVLLTRDFPGIVMVNQILTRQIDHVDGKTLVTFGAGENWHPCVQWAVDQNLAGIENLSLIPGTVGAAPMQNIGAYGVEIKDVFHSLKAFHKASGEVHSFYSPQCEFGYRESVFKNQLRDEYVICEVTFQLTDLSRENDYQVNTSYGAIEQVLKEKQIQDPSIQDVSKTVISIRQSKLPDPAEIGNSGSFFKNPIVPNHLAETLKLTYPNMPAYSAGNDHTKLAAGWLIEQCGWKGKRVGQTGAHAKQALVLVNYGNAKGSEVWQLAQDIQQSVKDKFGVELKPEVNVI